ncbi:G-type lectin S-receptor-like serine/threonine-protein kinase LECRK3 [Thalictrum thalictroides]|uniref:G-type lectin S-receptor-like serine/threonine-protein kinase LECRK3 n=1 Tax=Thalictrum thalictroides TaxID=46969 RepID=A0A7J6VH99_THATH|nr:G-type lectin S-receptor-like serine/threonine-protein kinase LECRK3 [Thalictrum thalictroides]
MQELRNTEYLRYDTQRFMPVQIEWCKEACLKDCFCAAAMYRSADRFCWLKGFPLSPGRMNFDDNIPLTALIKVGNSSAERVPRTVDMNPSSDENNEEDKKWILPGSILLAISVVVNLLFLFLVIYSGCYKKKTNRQTDSRPFGGNLYSFTYKELDEATDGFKEELGRGAFSTVYKGVLKSDSGCLVAVKRKNVVLEVGDEEIEILSDLVYECYEQKTLHRLVVNDEEAKNDSKSLESMVMVALWCIQDDTNLRPSMKKVAQMLEGVVEV